MTKTDQFNYHYMRQSRIKIKDWQSRKWRQESRLAIKKTETRFNTSSVIKKMKIIFKY